MPQFHLDPGRGDGAEWLAAQDEFTRGYVECMFWTEAASEELEDATVSDLSAEARASIIEDCKSFQDMPKDGHGRTLLDLAYDYATVEYDAMRAGNDFWLTRNGHGTGFWDRGLGDVGRRLTEISRYGECSLYFGDDGLLYLG